MKLELSPAAWQFWGLTALALIISLALASDLRRHRISNKLVLVALCAGLLAHLVGPVSEEGGGLFAFWPGALGAKGALLGALTGLGLFLPLYALRAMGAGDVKLMAALGSFAGPVDTLSLVLFIWVMGGVLGVGRMLWTGSAQRVMGNIMLMLLPVLHGGPRVFDPATQSADRMPYALAMASGLVGYGVWRCWLGGPPLLRF